MKSLTFVVCLAITSMGAWAQEPSPLGELTAGQYQAVEKAFSSLQSRFERGKATEYELLDAYKPFYQQEDKFRPQFAGWIKKYPKSAPAYLARGIYFRKLGEFARGTDYIYKTPKEKQDYMLVMYALSQVDLEKALSLDPKSFLPALHLLDIAQYEGDDLSATHYLEIGNAALPSNFIVRARYLTHLTPRWGGSYPSMDAFIERCRSEGMPEDHLALLRAIEFNDKGHSFDEGQYFQRAQVAYVEALTLSGSAPARFRRDYLPESSKICREPQFSGQAYCQ